MSVREGRLSRRKSRKFPCGQYSTMRYRGPKRMKSQIGYEITQSGNNNIIDHSFHLIFYWHTCKI